MTLIEQHGDVKEVTKEDQYQICAFARYHMRYENLNMELKALQNQIDELDCEDKILEIESEYPFNVGSGYIVAGEDDCDAITEQYIDPKLEKMHEQEESLKEQIQECKKFLDKLKVLLVGKFGDQINLNYEQK